MNVAAQAVMAADQLQIMAATVELVEAEAVAELVMVMEVQVETVTAK